MTPELADRLEEGRRMEKRQSLRYRALAAQATVRGLDGEAERLNELHADEQHHLSRLTARLLEEGETPHDLSSERPPVAELVRWTEQAGRWEEEEVAWYRETLDADPDERTRAVLEEILESELHHREHLGGKWMPAKGGG